MTLFTVRLTTPEETHDIGYRSVDECLGDDKLEYLLDATDAEVILWRGRLRITGTPLRSSRELREALDDAGSILGRTT